MNGPDSFSDEITIPSPENLPEIIGDEVESIIDIFKDLDFYRYWKNPEGKKVLVAGCAGTAWKIYAIFQPKNKGTAVLLDDNEFSPPIEALESSFPNVKFAFVSDSLSYYLRESPKQQFDLITFVRIQYLGKQLEETNSVGNYLLEDLAKILSPGGLLLLTGEFAQAKNQPHNPSLKLIKTKPLGNWSGATFSYPFTDHRGFLFQKSLYSGNRLRF